jgi:hypothetical protein
MLRVSRRAPRSAWIAKVLITMSPLPTLACNSMRLYRRRWCKSILFYFVGFASYKQQQFRCDPCFLKGGQLQLGSPIAHNADLANNWTSILSRCGAPTFTYVTPTSTVAPPSLYQTSTVNGTRSNSTTCVFGSYTVQAGDTCASISSSKGIVSDQVRNLSLKFSYGLLIYYSSIASLLH